LRRVSMARDARRRIRNREGDAHDRHRRFAAAVVSRPQPPPVEHPARRQSRLAVRRLRIVCADLDGRSGHALLARAVAVSADSRLYRHGRRHHAAGLGIGGIVGGVLADYIGRKRTIILAILAYSITTGLTAVSFDWISFAILRFLVGIAIGSEWATGSSMMAELWPDHARGRGAGLMQCGIGIGNFLAAFVWLYVGAFGPES